MRDMSDIELIDLTSVGKRLRYAREQKGKLWTQAHLATVSGVGVSTIGMIEAGHRVSKGSLPALSEALGIRHRWLANAEGDMTNPFAGLATPAPPVDGDEQAQVTLTKVGTARAVMPKPLSEESERRLTRLLAVVYQIPEDRRPGALSAAIEVLLDHLPPPPNA